MQEGNTEEHTYWFLPSGDLFVFRKGWPLAARPSAPSRQGSLLLNRVAPSFESVHRSYETNANNNDLLLVAAARSGGHGTLDGCNTV